MLNRSVGRIYFNLYNAIWVGLVLILDGQRDDCTYDLEEVNRRTPD